MRDGVRSSRREELGGGGECDGVRLRETIGCETRREKSVRQTGDSDDKADEWWGEI